VTRISGVEMVVDGIVSTALSKANNGRTLMKKRDSGLRSQDEVA